MQFYKVLVAGQKFHGNEPLTYHAETSIAIGSLVEVPLRSAVVLGIVVGKDKPTSFKTKPLKMVGTFRIPKNSLALIDWLQTYYPSPIGYITQLFTPPYPPLPSEKQLAAINKYVAELNYQPAPLLELHAEQKRATDRIMSQPGPATTLLHGETGSGKTRLYMELAQQTLQVGRSVLMLTPEISLTPQLSQQFVRHFGDSVMLLHSKLTNLQRREAWFELATSNIHGKARIVIGPRSALFAPLEDIGLVIMDEAHETAYKQEQLPRYQSSRVAGAIASIHKARFIMGTATPNIADYYTAKQLNVPIVTMKKSSVVAEDTTQIAVIDMKDSTERSQHYFLSKALLKATDEAMERGEQALLFLNRRGTARLVLCEECGWEALCTTCDIPITYHGDRHQLVCHTCGQSLHVPTACPKCGHAGILFKSYGTKAIADFFIKRYPHKTVARFDLDNKKEERLETVFEAVKSGSVDIIVGTQILAKGLDLPHLSVVGVVLADTSLYLPDYTAEERTWQLLHQVIGRVGRGHRDGHVVIQTYHPSSPAINAAVNNEFDTFYEQQLQQRLAFHFPPFVYLMKIICNRKSAAQAERSLQNVKQTITGHNPKLKLEGPAPSFYEKQAGGYQWQLIVKAHRRHHLTDLIKLLPANFSYDLDPSDLL